MDPDFDAFAAQRMMMGLSDNPQFLNDGFARMFRQCWDARRGDDGEFDAMTAKF